MNTSVIKLPRFIICFIYIEYKFRLKFKINMNSEIESSRLSFNFCCDVRTQVIIENKYRLKISKSVNGLWEPIKWKNNDINKCM